MRKLLSLIVVTIPLLSQAALNQVAENTTALILPAVVDLAAHATITSTNRVSVAGNFVREGRTVRQYTANGWEACPSYRSLVVVQATEGDGTAIVDDGVGPIAHLKAGQVLTITDSHVTGNAYSVTASGGSVTVFSSQR